MLLLNTVFLPFLGQFLADGDAAHALFDPVVGVALGFVKFPTALCG